MMWRSLIASIVLGSAHLMAAPQLQIVQPVYDFGNRERGETVEHTFVIRNAGDSNLEITKIKPACGCTTAQLAQTTVAPGAEVHLPVKLSLRAQKGPQTRDIEVESNDPQNPKVQLTLKGVATQRVRLTPERLNLGKMEPDKPVSASYEVLTEPTLPLNIEEIVTSGPNLKATVETLETGHRFKVHVTAEPPFEVGPFRGWVHLKTDNRGEYRVVAIAVPGNVEGDLTVSAREFQVPASATAPLSRDVMVGPGKVQKFKILGVDLPSSDMKADIMPIGRGYRVRIANIVPDPMLNGATATIKTDVASLPEIHVSFEVVGNPPVKPASDVQPKGPEAHVVPTELEQDREKRRVHQVGVGQLLEIEGRTLSGDNFDSRSLRGRPVVAVFWASWCLPCRAELPRVRALYDQHHAQGLEVLGISVDRSERDAEAFIKEHSIPWPNLHAHTQPIEQNPATRYGVRAVPCVFLLDRDHRAVATEARGEQLVTAVERLMASLDQL